MSKYFFFLLLLVSQIYSDTLPISLKNNWLGKEGVHLEFKDKDTWQKFKELTINSNDFKELKNTDGINITLYKSIEISKEDLNSIQESTSILFPYLSNVYEIHFNGEKISSKGKFENGKVIKPGFTRNVIAKIPIRLLKEKNEIFVILKGMKGEEISLYGDDITDLDFHSANVLKTSERTNLMLLFMYAFVGFYHLLLFVKRKQEVYNLYFGLFCVSLSIYIYTRSTAVYELGLDPMLVTRIEYIDLFHITGFSVAFFENFLRNRNSYITKGVFIFIWILSIPTIFISTALTYKTLLAWQLFTLICFIYLIYLMISSIYRKHQDSKRLFLGFIVLVFFAVWDVVGAMAITKSIKNLGLMPYGFFIFVIGIAVVLANKFLRVHNEVEELNESLERKVEERTRELQKSLTEVNDLKLQQDGDYFLTTLLIKPLMVNQAKSQKIKIDFYIKQKKSFVFKNKTYQIGGDMCIANNIKLQGKNYCVFINGDAMGKSIQGAGGALVLGVVFRSIIERTKIFKPNMELFPEQWIKICFIELQNVFVSFDGSMLVSIVMGLVEENTGALYFLNAEHPWTVLYRDNKASFMENQLYLHKVGMLGLDGSLRVNVHQMQSGDSIIIGSDGRDDIMLGMDSEGGRNINEDYDKFLRNVEEGQGELEGITKSILKLGEFTDDYTLIKISFNDETEQGILIPESYYDFISKGDIEANKGNLENAIIEYNKAISVYKTQESYLRLSSIYLKEKRFTEFVKVSSEYLDRYPFDSEEFYKISYAYKFLEEFAKAADYGECLRLRDPLHIKNLVNLADVYRKLKNIPRAKKLILEILRIEPTNPKAIELQDILNQEQNIHV